MAVMVLAEDDEDVSMLLKRIFSRAGFTVHAAADGQAALELVAREHPDVVLSDLDMPVMTGLQLCRAIRSDEQLRRTPVALISGSLQHGDPRAVEVKACDVALKPFHNGELVSAMRHLCDLGAHDHDDPDVPCPLAAGDRAGGRE